MQKIISCLLAAFLCMNMAVAVFASQPAKNKENPVQNTVPAVSSDAFVVMDSQTGQVLIEKNMHKKEFPASITKILTGAMALELGDPKDQYVITEEDVFSYKFPGTTYVALTHDEVVTVEQLLYATLMMSANDGANCLGSYVAQKCDKGEMDENGSVSNVKGFVTMMNEKLKKIGAVNTHFTSAHGLHDPEHVTTAYDMALITKYALSVDGFRQYFGATSYTMAPTNMQPEERKWGTQAGIFTPSNKYYYKGASGAKLGYTDEAGHTMVTVAERDGREVICVLLGCRKGDWTDHKETISLLDYCFNNFESVVFTPDDLKQKTVPVYKDGEIYEKARITPYGEYRIQLHKLLSKQDIKFTSNAPGRFQFGEDMKISLSFAMSKAAQKKVEGAMYSELGNLPMKVEVVPLVEEKEKTGFDFSKVRAAVLEVLKVAGIIFLALVVLILILRAYNIRKYRKLAAKRRRARRQNPQGPHNPQNRPNSGSSQNIRNKR